MRGTDIERSEVEREAEEWFRAEWDPGRTVGDWWAALAASGWAFPSWPEGFGGRGLSMGESRAVTRARRRVGAYGPPNGVATFLVAPTLLAMGSEEQQRRYLPGIVDGTNPWCQLFSEPGSGSDMASLGTRAVLDGEQWRIDGQKVWNSGAHYADYGILIARSDPELPKHRGVTYFLIDMRQPGVDVRPLREMTGDAAFNEVFLADAVVDDRDRVGERGDGWRVAMATLSFERDPDNPGLGDTAAFFQADLDATVDDHMAAEAEAIDGFSIALSGKGGQVFEQVIDMRRDDMGVVARDRLAAVHGMRRVTGLSSQRAAGSVAAGRPPGPEVATLKVIGGQIGREIRDLGLESLGADGMLWGDDVPDGGALHRYAMFTPAQSIAGGTDEVLRNSIGERVLGLPREPDEAARRSTPWSELPRS